MTDYTSLSALYNGALVVDVDSVNWGEPKIDQSVFHLALITHELRTIETRSGRNFRFTIAPNTITFVRPGEVEAVHAEFPKEVNRVSMTSFVFRESLALDTLNDVNLDGLRELSDPTMASLLRASATLGPDADPLLVDHVTMAILHRIRGLRPRPDIKSKGRIERAITYINERIDQKMTLAELAGAAAMSQHHFARTFRQVTGMTPLAYVTARRIDKAKSLIARSKHPMGLIASLCGFSSQSHFSVAFREIVGVTPLEYRRQIAK